MNTNMLCPQSATMLEVLEQIKQNGKGIVFIIDGQNRVIGVLTDGDIRNLLLKGAQLHESIDGKFNRNFVYALTNEAPEDALKKTSEKIRIVPLLDAEHHYVDYYEFTQRLYLPVASPELIGNEFKYLVDAFLSTWISSTGRYIGEFEVAFAEFCQTKHAVAVSNGTTALHLALLALGVGPGDEVIVPDLTFAASVNCVIHAGATPVIVDINRRDWCIDAEKIEAAITTKTKAIIPVHLYGQPCDMKALMAVAKKHNLFIVEDAAEAHGATFDGQPVGSFGEIGCFSFYGNKVITTGEGGMCVTNSDELAAKMRMLRDHGMSKDKKYWHEVIGYNYRMTNLQAAIGLGQVERITETLKNRRQLEAQYRQTLKECDLIEFQADDLPGRKKITWLISALVKNGKRDLLMTKLKEKGIDSRPFFYALSTMPLYQKYVHSSQVSQEISAMGINFPTLSALHSDSLETIKQTIMEMEADSN